MQDLLAVDGGGRAAADSRAVPLLVAALATHGASADVMMDGLSALAQLMTDDRAHVPLLRGHRLSEVVRAVRQHRTAWDVVAVALVLLGRLASTRPGRAVLYDVRAAELAIEAMLAFPLSVPVQCLGCELLHRMGDSPTAQQRRRLLALGALETVVEAVRRFPSEQKLQRVAFLTLSELCDTEETRRALGRVGGVPAILRAVGRLSKDLAVARDGCMLLRKLTLSSTVRKQVVAADAAALVRRVLGRHPTDEPLLAHGRALQRSLRGCQLPTPQSRPPTTCRTPAALRAPRNAHTAP
eukprot:EG_transcript_12312